MVAGSRIIEIARKEIGVTENPPGTNRVKYNDWIWDREVFDGDRTDSNGKKSSYAWCGSFVSWVFDQAGARLGKLDMLRGFIGCPYAVKNIDKWGKIVTNPKPGCVVFYDWDGNGTFDHTSIFEKDNGDGTFTAIEGNTAYPKATMTKEQAMRANSNGGAVIERSDRHYKNVIFVQPNVLEA